MLERMASLVAAGKSFAVETTLATRGYVRLISHWQQRGYHIKLCFLRLPTPEFAIRRVAQRVSQGGHAVAPDIIRRRFVRGLANLQRYYLSSVDEWAIFDASTLPPALIEAGPPRLREEPRQTGLEHASPDFLTGLDAAMRRASARAVERARHAGLEPVVQACAAPLPSR